jgi:hypothetical protein
MDSVLTEGKQCEIVIRKGGDVIWVFTENGTVCRVQNIETLTIVDERDDKTGYRGDATLSPEFPGVKESL